ncbi:hypothetical protein L2Y94_09820 [Luteibacter aegosomatis]|uniref:hypothetical protein n=1 Tax=Luteibacter aegosomatis TaxID=2911537 RepID=UPI001FFB2FCD|nr:hypothetical protein [Luteibacter aegosomatis]UPG87626.1 hypothetical protein L2Y94_09820 [Luteibacter aegosomatis]
MSDRLDRFKARKILTQASDGPRLVGLPSENGEPLDIGHVDQAFVDRVADREQPVDLSVCHAEVESLLNRMSQDIERERFGRLMVDARRGVLQSIAGPFGLGAVVGAADRVGGNVDTIHNARQGIYATQGEADAYANRGEYDSGAYHAHQDYVATNKRQGEQHAAGTLIDVHTGKPLAADAKRNLDHLKSAKAIHDDPGRVLAGVDGPDLANREANLASTQESINKSKKADGAERFNERLSQTREQRQAQIAQLREQGVATPLTDKDRKTLAKLEALESVDREHSESAGRKAEADGDAVVDKAYYGSRKFAGNVALQGGREAVTVGIQQAFGELLTEFFASVFEEADDWYRQGRKHAAMTDELLERFRSVATRVASKWSHAVQAFKGGAIAGLLNSIVTTLVNVFVTTQKRLARMVREGLLSLVRALKMVVFPPDGTSYRETLHEATKIAFAGGVVIGGIVLEEIVHKYISSVPALGFLADVATAVIVGSITAVVMALSAYALDKLDLFGVNEARRLGQSTTRLTSGALEHAALCEVLVLELEAIGDPTHVAGA